MKIFIATGGTGGHIIPAISCAKYLAQKNHKVIILGDKKSRDYLLVDKLQFYKIFSSKIGDSFLMKSLSFLKISLGIIQSFFLILTYRPKYIICFGGYSTFPAGIAAIITRTKIIIHEQNAHIGKVNKILAKFSYKIALSFQSTSGLENLKQDNKIHHVGLPIKDEISLLHAKPYIMPNITPKSFDMSSRMGYDVLLKSDFGQISDSKEFFIITVIGGSGGARIFSDILPKAIFNIKNELKPQILIFQQCRADLLSETFNKYKSYNINIILDSFFNDMPALLANSHLIIARGGASTLFELSAAKKPAIIVPFAQSSDNHQQKNAQYFSDNNAAILIDENKFSINNVTKILNEIILNEAKLKNLSNNISKLAKLDANENILKLIND